MRWVLASVLQKHFDSVGKDSASNARAFEGQVNAPDFWKVWREASNLLLYSLYLKSYRQEL